MDPSRLSRLGLAWPGLFVVWPSSSGAYAMSSSDFRLRDKREDLGMCFQGQGSPG